MPSRGPMSGSDTTPASCCAMLPHVLPCRRGSAVLRAQPHPPSARSCKIAFAAATVRVRCPSMLHTYVPAARQAAHNTAAGHRPPRCAVQPGVPRIRAWWNAPPRTTAATNSARLSGAPVVCSSAPMTGTITVSAGCTSMTGTLPRPAACACVHPCLPTGLSACACACEPCWTLGLRPR